MLPSRHSALGLLLLLLTPACPSTPPPVSAEVVELPRPSALPEPSSRGATRPSSPVAAGRRVGDPIFVEWRGGWYPAKILAQEPDGSALIHYEGYEDSWDETVSRDRIRDQKPSEP